MCRININKLEWHSVERTNSAKAADLAEFSLLIKQTPGETYPMSRGIVEPHITITVTHRHMNDPHYRQI